MAAAYDLRAEPWLPVRTLGRVVEIGLRELFTTAHQHNDLAVSSPPAASGMWRILAAFTARVTGLDKAPDGPQGWSKRRLEVLQHGRFDPEAFDEYIERFGLTDRFFLFGDVARPFLQDPRLAEQCVAKTSGINKLDMTRPAGQNPVWWSHHHDEDPQALSPTDALFALIIWLYYAPSTRCATRRVQGISDSNLLSGPLRSTMSYHPVAEDLFASLVLSIPGPTGWGTADIPDECPWERAELPDPLEIPPAPSSRGPCSLLTTRTDTAVLLIPDASGLSVVDCWVTWSTLRELGLAPGRDPNLIYTTTTSKDGTVRVASRRADANRAL
jgi:CRISPR system Cascade subunit CasA